jgi:hypothetical protein
MIPAAEAQGETAADDLRALVVAATPASAARVRE